MEGDIRGYPAQYRDTVRKIGKYRNTVYKNRRNTDTVFMIGHDYSKLYPSRVFACLKHFCTSNQPQPLRGNVRGPRIDRNDRKGCPANFIHHRLTVRNCVIIYHLSKVLKMLRCIRQESAINCTAIP